MSTESQGSTIVRFGMAPEQGEVLGGLVTGSVAGGQPREGADDVDIHVRLGRCRSEKFKLTVDSRP